MQTWIRMTEGVIKQVIVAMESPGEGWVQYPYYCDLAGAGNIAGRNISEFDELGNFLPVEEPSAEEPLITEA